MHWRKKISNFNNPSIPCYLCICNNFFEIRWLLFVCFSLYFLSKWLMAEIIITLYWWHNHRKTMTYHKTWTAFITKLFCKHAKSKFACVKSNCTTVLITTLRIFCTHFENIFRLTVNKSKWIVMRKQIFHEIIERFQIWSLIHWQPSSSHMETSHWICPVN